MPPFWKSNQGKLVIGGCGTQVGMLLTLGALAALLFVCGVCATANLLSMSLTQQVVAQSAGPGEPVEALSNDQDVSLLLEEVDLLFRSVDTLQAKAVSQFVPPSPSGSPTLRADRQDVILHTGPDVGYNQAGMLQPGETLEIAGRSSDSTWWLVSTNDGRFGWVADSGVVTANLNDSIPVVIAPSQLGQPASSVSSIADSARITPTVFATPTPALPPGTPTPSAEASRQYVEDMSSYERLKWQLLVPPVSASISPDGGQIAITERIKLYTVTTDGALTTVWFEDSDKRGPLGGAVWSPEGKHVAFVVGFKHKYCRPCRAVALLNFDDGAITYLTPPEEHLDTDMPRWTQDGRLLINAHPGEPADGIAYVYDIYDQHKEAAGVYVLSASHEGQKWYPWRPGRTWRAGVSERADSYNSD